MLRAKDESLGMRSEIEITTKHATVRSRFSMQDLELSFLDASVTFFVGSF